MNTIYMNVYVLMTGSKATIGLIPYNYRHYTPGIIRRPIHGIYLAITVYIPAKWHTWQPEPYI